MTQIKVGSRVVTRKFESDEYCGWDNIMAHAEEGFVTNIECGGKRIMVKHNNFSFPLGWPPSAVELVSKEWEPEYGKEYEFSMNQKDWSKKIFVGMNPNKNSAYNYLAMDNVDDCGSYRFIRPIRRTLVEKIVAYFNDRGFCFEYAKIQDDIMDIIKSHNEEI